MIELRGVGSRQAMHSLDALRLMEEPSADAELRDPFPCVPVQLDHLQPFTLAYHSQNLSSNMCLNTPQEAELSYVRRLCSDFQNLKTSISLDLVTDIFSIASSKPKAT